MFRAVDMSIFLNRRTSTSPQITMKLLQQSNPRPVLVQTIAISGRSVHFVTSEMFESVQLRRGEIDPPTGGCIPSTLLWI